MRIGFSATGLVLSLLCASCSPADGTTDPRRQAEAAVSKQGSELPGEVGREVGQIFPGASEVRLFVELTREDRGTPVYSKSKGRLLTTAERATFERALRINKMPEWMVGCFIPHHFFRYYDVRGKQIGEVQVCFCCGGVRAMGASNVRVGENELLEMDHGLMEAFVKSLGEPTDVQCV